MQIVKKGKYYYLKHSVRMGNKVTSKDKYLGSKIPPDIDLIRKKFLSDLNKDLIDKFDKIKSNFQIDWAKTPKSIREEQLKELSIAFTYNTNAIEGSTITLSETRMIINDEKAPSKSLNDIKETEAHSNVFLAMMEKNQMITESLLLNWHREIFSETKPDMSGKYRDYLVRVGDYVAPDWQDVKDLIRGLVRFINQDKSNPVNLSARAHFRFESIHPFGDGNGRIGRLLMNQILWHAGYPILIVEYKKRNSYYRAFQKGEEGFVNYFFRRYLSVHKRYLK